MIDVPKVTLGGKEYPVPKMAVRQLRVILPKAMKLISELGPMMQAAVGLKDESLSVEERMGLLGQVDLSEATFDLLAEVVQIGVQRGTPTFTTAFMLDEPIELGELMAALPVILGQTGMATPVTKSDASGDGGASVGAAAAGGNSAAGEAPPRENPSM